MESTSAVQMVLVESGVQGKGISKLARDGDSHLGYGYLKITGCLSAMFVECEDKMQRRDLHPAPQEGIGIDKRLTPTPITTTGPLLSSFQKRIILLNQLNGLLNFLLVCFNPPQCIFNVLPSLIIFTLDCWRVWANSLFSTWAVHVGYNGNFFKVASTQGHSGEHAHTVVALEG